MAVRADWHPGQVPDPWPVSRNVDLENRAGIHNFYVNAHNFYVNASDVVGYAFGVKLYCTNPACIIGAIGELDRFHGDPRVTVDSEVALAVLAELYKINPNDEWSFDSGDFPKIVFADQAHDGCTPDNGYEHGQCGDQCAVCHEHLGFECPNVEEQEWSQE